MTAQSIAADAFSRLGAEVASRPVFWALFALMFVFIALAALCCFEQPKRVLRASLSALLAVECAWFMSSGFLG